MTTKKQNLLLQWKKIVLSINFLSSYKIVARHSNVGYNCVVDKQKYVKASNVWIMKHVFLTTQVANFGDLRELNWSIYYIGKPFHTSYWDTDTKLQGKNSLYGYNFVSDKVDSPPYEFSIFVTRSQTSSILKNPECSHNLLLDMSSADRITKKFEIDFNASFETLAKKSSLLAIAIETIHWMCKRTKKH